jgi:DNA-binding response OmpR family regulator
LLDIRLAGGDGLAYCEAIRAITAAPIIILSAYGDIGQKLRAFDQGVTDFVTKPYDSAELVARIQAVLRRQHEQQSLATTLHIGALTINFDQHRVSVDGVEIALSPTEYRLLAYLARNAGRTLVAAALLEHAWGTAYRGDYPSLHLYISRLRRKLNDPARSPRYILTVPGVGYRMATPDEFAA